MATPPFRRPLEEMLEWSSQDILEQPGQVSGTFWSQGKRTSAKSAKTAQMSKRTEKTYRVHLAAVGSYLLAFVFFAGVCCYLPLSVFFCNFFFQIAHKKGPDLQNGCTMTRTWLQDGSLDRFGTSRRALEAASFTFFFVTFRSATLGPQSESGVITKHFLGRKLFALAPPTKATGGLKALRLWGEEFGETNCFVSFLNHQSIRDPCVYLPNLSIYLSVYLSIKSSWSP